MKDLNRKAQMYILGTILAGLGLLMWSLIHFDWQKLWMTLALSVLASLSLIFKVEGTTSRSHYNISFLIYAFTFVLLGPEATVLVTTVANIAEWIWHRYPWYIPSFNIFSHVVVIYITGMFYRSLNPDLVSVSLHDVAVIFATLSAFTLVNHLLVGLVIWFARGENFKKSGIFGFFPLALDLILLCMGAGVAMIWMVSPYAIVFVLLPLYLIYTTLKVPALERQTETDPKTGVFNARYFEQALQSELQRSNRFDRPLTVVMGDLDLLRNINNTYGHLAGDEVLIGVARILKNTTREYDIVARFGGEEFAILMPETKSSDAMVRMEEVRRAIEAAEFTVQTSVTPIKATMSFGIAEREGFEQTLKDLIHNADAALYHSKLKGRNRVFIYSEQGYVNLFSHVENAEAALAPESALSTSPALDTATPISASHSESPHCEAETRIGDKENTRPIPQRSPLASWLYIFGMALTSIVLFGLLYQPGVPVHWIDLGAFTLLVLLTEWLSIEIYVRDTAISTSAAPMIAGFLLFGPPAAPVLSLAVALVAMIKHSSPPKRFVFNLCNQMIAGLLCIGVSTVTGAHFINLVTWQLFILSSISAGIIYLSTTWLIAMGMSLEFNHHTVKEIWIDKFSWLAPYYLSMGIISYALIYSYNAAGLFGLLVVLVPLMMLRMSQMQYLDKTKVVVQELKEKNLAIQGSAEEIHKLNEGLLNALAEVVDLRDPFVLGHSKQVARIAELLATRLGLPTKQVELIHKAGLVHDIGKLGISEAILFKPGKLTPFEYEVIKGHVTLGAEILESSYSLHDLVPIVRFHHEHYDGKGYPSGLPGSQIPIEARILAVADAVEAMASDRPYRRGRDQQEIIDELNRCAGSQFDPLVVRAFVDLVKEHRESLIVNSARKIEASEKEHALLVSPKTVWAP
jgi:diguanylate cyclase (GGDEF)-like protein/putative nucleotidyltransferase with HDIG domain